MTVEIAFPLEFIVQGTPVLSQASRSDTKTTWKQRVRRASYAVVPEGHFSTNSSLAITLFYFPDGPMKDDVDNIVKLILDALSNHIYQDDRQIERVWIQKFEPGHAFQFNDSTAILKKRRPIQSRYFTYE